MSRNSEITALTIYHAATVPNTNAGKCIARARWSRRKKWQSRKSPNRRATGRK